MSPTGPQKWGLSSGDREKSTQGPQASPGHLCILCLFPSHLGRPCSGTSGRANSLRQLPVLTPLSPQPDQGKEVVLSLQRHPRTSGRVACHERVGLLLRPSSSCVCCRTRVLFLSSCAASPLLRAFHDPLWSFLVRPTRCRRPTGQAYLVPLHFHRLRFQSHQPISILSPCCPHCCLLWEGRSSLPSDPLRTFLDRTLSAGCPRAHLRWFRWYSSWRDTPTVGCQRELGQTQKHWALVKTEPRGWR